MNELRKSGGAWLLAATLMIPMEAMAEHRLAVEPSIDVTSILDDNLYFSEESPVRDRIQRITPALALRFDSPRVSARAAYAIDSEKFESNSSLDNDRARERAGIGLDYHAGPRLTLSFNAGYVTDTLADLNRETGLGSSRLRGRQFSISPSAHFRFSPRLTARASASSMTTDVENGMGVRSQIETIALERLITPRDVLSLDYQHSDVVFDQQSDFPRAETSPSTNTDVVLAGWSRNLGGNTHLMLRAGPRITDGIAAADLSASLSHDWRLSSIAVSLLRGQTTVIGHVGAVETETLQARFTLAPSRRLTAFAAPAVIRSAHDELQGTVYRVSLGARYIVTPLVGVDVAYNHDTQDGTIDPLRADAEFSRDTLTFGFTTRWSSADRYGTGRAR